MGWYKIHENPFKTGLSAAIAEDFVTARAALWTAVGDDSCHELAWLWLAKVAETREERQLCLSRALAIDPRNERTRRLLAAVEDRAGDGGKPEATGSCPICQLPWAEPPKRCARCRCLLTFENPSVFLSALDVDRRLAHQAIERLQSEKSLTDGQRLQLALAHLNLGDLFESRAQLSRLSQVDPLDEQIEGLLDTISRQLEQIELDSGFETETIDRPTPEELGML